MRLNTRLAMHCRIVNRVIATSVEVIRSRYQGSEERNTGLAIIFGGGENLPVPVRRGILVTVRTEYHFKSRICGVFSRVDG